ncbi:MAG: hypothetical protein IKV97_02715 [Clostridia bacterium]|nr:hypothetical protein [Clostridia bacterium]
MQGYFIWVAVLIISVAVECMTSALISVWFVPASIVCIILDLVGVTNIYIQLAVFVIISALLVYLLRNKIKSSFTKKVEKTNVDSLVGRIAVAEDDIPAGDIGRVRIGGMSWSAVICENRRVLAGEKVRVADISGVKLICAPIENKLAPTSELIGKQARVESVIDNFSASGTIMCEGRIFPAESIDNGIIEKNTVVVISEIRDGKAVCNKLRETADVI